MRGDFGDLRFTDSSGTTSIPYWIESHVSSASSTVWARLPSVPASGSADIYAYYGNSAVETTGSGTTTFPFYDNFETGNISDYGGNTTGYFNVGTANVYNGTYSLDAQGNETGQTTTGMYRTDVTVPRGSTLRFFQYIDTNPVSGGNDEPCTLFAVQGAGQNYAVCLKVFGTDQLIIGKDITSNAPGSKQLSAKNVSYTTGWYEVVTDWKAGGVIDVSVYHPIGTLFATTSATDTTYSSGGFGFSYWTQHGAWDLYTARPYATTTPTYVFGEEQEGGGATWRAPQDEPISNIEEGELLRLRFSVLDSGDPIVDGAFRLEVASKGGFGSCKSVPYGSFAAVPTETGGCGTAAACMISSTHFTSRASTTQLLERPDVSYDYTFGQIVSDPHNETGPVTLGENEFAEFEYAFALTSYAVDDAYCFRVTDDGSPLDNYSVVAEAQLLHGPTVNNLSLNGGASIALLEGTTMSVVATATVRDLNGYQDIVAATSTIYRSGVGANCEPDDNNCYHADAFMCVLDPCSGTDCVVTCTVEMNYFAEPTDDGVFEAQDWRVRMSVVDSTNLYGAATSLGTDVLTMRALSVVGAIDYGALEVGQDTGWSDATTTVRNVGNQRLNLNLTGTDLEAPPVSAIPAYYQKFATTTFDYGTCPITMGSCNTIFSTTTTYTPVDIAKATSTVPVTDNIYWGIAIPSGTAGVPHEGFNTFIATQ
jgi:hypothetical protein